MEHFVSFVTLPTLPTLAPLQHTARLTEHLNNYHSSVIETPFCQSSFIHSTLAESNQYPLVIRLWSGWDGRG